MKSDLIVITAQPGCSYNSTCDFGSHISPSPVSTRYALGVSCRSSTAMTMPYWLAKEKGLI